MYIRQVQALLFEVDYNKDKLSAIYELCIPYQDSFLKVWLDRGENFNYEYIRFFKDIFDRVFIIVSLNKSIIVRQLLEDNDLKVLDERRVLVGLPTADIEEYEFLASSITSISLMG